MRVQKRVFRHFLQKRIHSKCQQIPECPQLFERTFNGVLGALNDENPMTCSLAKGFETLSAFIQANGIVPPD